MTTIKSDQQLLAEVIITKLKELKATTWRNGFNRTWEMEVCDAIHQSGLGSWESFWKDFINFGAKSKINKINLAMLWFEGDMAVINLIDEIDAQSKSKGVFEMPSWGTYGT